MKCLLLRAFFILVFSGSGLIASAQIIDLEDQLILKLPFNGNALDVSEQSIPTKVEGATLTTDRYGNLNSAYLFNGINNYINLNNNMPLITAKSFTVSIWAKIVGKSFSENTSNSLFEQRDDDALLISAESTIHFNADNFNEVRIILRSINNPNGVTTVACSYIYDDKWHHYVSRLDDDRNLEIFIDANLYCTGTFTDDGDFTSSIDHVNIGSHHYKGAIKGAFNGAIDDIHIYNRALNNCEIEALYSGLPTEER